jgi:transposase
VIEVNRPDKAERHRIGKSDPIDAYAAARAALSGRASVIPKDDAVSGIRALHNAARSAVKARTATLNQIAPQGTDRGSGSPIRAPAEVVLLQFSDEGDQLFAAADLAVGSE